MGRSIERIEQDIAELEQETKAIAKELYSVYSSYLAALGQAMRQQLILACYQVCTQGYAEAFLKLSFSQRQQLQKDLRVLASQAQQKLLSSLHSPSAKETPDLPFPSVGLTIVRELGNPEVTAVSSPDVERDLPSSEPTERAPLDTSELQQRGNPQQLTHWQENVEEAIVKTLQTASYKANRLLQQTGILPKKLAEPFLEAASRAEASESAAVAGPPNLLNLLIETDSSDESSSSSVTQLMAIHLRLSEIEFSDSMVMAGRNQIRQLGAKVSKLGREYHKKQRELSVAEAEAAWRASWIDD